MCDLGGFEKSRYCSFSHPSLSVFYLYLKFLPLSFLLQIDLCLQKSLGKMKIVSGFNISKLCSILCARFPGEYISYLSVILSEVVLGQIVCAPAIRVQHSGVEPLMKGWVEGCRLNLIYFICYSKLILIDLTSVKFLLPHPEVTCNQWEIILLRMFNISQKCKRHPC